MGGLRLSKGIIVPYNGKLQYIPKGTFIRDYGVYIPFSTIFVDTEIPEGDGNLDHLLPKLSEEAKTIWFFQIPRQAIDRESIEGLIKDDFVEGDESIAPFPCWVDDKGIKDIRFYPPKLSFLDYYSHDPIKKIAIFSKYRESGTIDEEYEETFKDKTVIIYKSYSTNDHMIASIHSVKAWVEPYDVVLDIDDICIGKNYWVRNRNDINSWRGFGYHIENITKSSNHTLFEVRDITDFNTLSKETHIIEATDDFLFIEKKHDSLLDEFFLNHLIAHIDYP